MNKLKVRLVKGLAGIKQRFGLRPALAVACIDNRPVDLCDVLTIRLVSVEDGGHFAIR